MRILFLGDIVGKTGRQAVQQVLPSLTNDHKPDFVIVNGENTAAGIGITPALADELFDWGVDAVTLGNHAFNKKDIGPYLDNNDRIVRPANYPPGTPGKGTAQLTKNGHTLTVMNLCGRVFMQEYDDPFRMADRLLEDSNGPVFIDFHAEATSEKTAFFYHVDGRASVVVGTHTHVQTSDERILPGGTAVITDAGMCGPQDSIIGMDKDIILRRFLTLMPERFEVPGGRSVISGVVVDVKEDGTAESISRILWRDI